MKTVKILSIAGGLFFLLTVMCANPEYNNKFDMNGDNPYHGDIGCLGDSDGDGIADIVDPDAPAECHRQSTPTLTLKGDSVTVIALNDPTGMVPQLLTMVNVSDSVYQNLSISDVHTTSNVFTSQCGGPFTITYTVKNMANGIATVQRTVIVDCKGPEIHMKGISPIDVDSGKPYVDSGATAYDSVDKEAKQVTTIGLPLNTATVHEDSVIYTATDKVGNISRVKRIVRVTPVIVIDNDVPIITLIGSADTSIQIGVGSYSDPGATAWDTTEHDITAKIVKSGSVNAAVVANYTLTYNVSDNAGHAAPTVTRMVRITQIDTGPDVTRPEVRLLGKNPDSVLVGAKWTEPGYWVWDNRDTVGLGATVQVTGGPVDASKEGTFTLIYTVKDKAPTPNTSLPKARTVIVYTKVADDNIPPVIKLDGACGAKCTTDIGTKYTGSATATDSAPGKQPVILTQNIKTVVYDSANAVVDFNTFYTKLGLYKITYDVSDASGNKATQVSRTVFVKDTTPLAPDSMFARYGVPLTDSLPTISATYTHSPFTVDGPSTGVPKLTQVKTFRINWDLFNKQIFNFEFVLTNGNSLDLRGSVTSNTFASKTPSFTLKNVTAIQNLNGTYYITATTSKCVWVRTDGRFAIVFK